MAKQRYGLNQDSNLRRKNKKELGLRLMLTIKELIVELYSSLDDTSKSQRLITYMGFIAKMRTWLFSRLQDILKPMTAEEN
jgi:hypothetical protein